MVRIALACVLGGAAAVLLRLAGARLGRPVPRFIAGGAGIIVGWSMLVGLVVARGSLLVLPAMALLAAGMGVAAPVKTRGRAAAMTQWWGEAQLWAVGVAGFGGWWLAGGAWPKLLLGGGLILAAGLLAVDVWSVAAAALCVAASLAAAGARGPAAGLALVVAVACLGEAPVLPLSVGLGVVMAVMLEAAPRGGRAGMVAVAAGFVCLGLMFWWRRRFGRFGRAAGGVRAAVAAGVVCLVAFSAAALVGLR